MRRRSCLIAGGAMAAGGLAALAGLSALSPVTLLNAMAEPGPTRRGIRYGSDARQALDLYSPPGDGPHPCLVFFYGGSWDSGARDIYRFVGAAFAAHGFATIIPDYRLYPAVRYPDFLHDCAAAFAWTHNNRAEIGAIGPPALLGHSAGAYNAAMLALDPTLLGAHGLVPSRDIACMTGLAGPYDFLPIEAQRLRTIFGADAHGMAPPETQPITHVDGTNPAMLLMAGQKDRTVDPGNTHRLAARIRQHGGRVETRLYPGIDHREILGAVAPALRCLAPTFTQTLAFLNQFKTEVPS